MVVYHKVEFDKPKKKTHVVEYSYYQYTFSNLVLDESVTFVIMFYDAEGNALKTSLVKIEGEDYNKWGLDDQYIKDWIADYITKQDYFDAEPEIVEPEPEAEPEAEAEAEAETTEE